MSQDEPEGKPERKAEQRTRWSLPVKQDRSRATRDKLLKAGFKLLKRKQFEQLSVADIAAAAGCSVGAFYVRFVDKERYFLALAEQFRAERRDEIDAAYAAITPRSLVGEALTRELEFVRGHANLWRAALRKSAADPQFWEEFRALGRHSTDLFVEHYGRHLGRALDDEQVKHIRFAFQVLRSTLNNTILNQPGPLRLDEPDFRAQLERAFRLVAGIS